MVYRDTYIGNCLIRRIYTAYNETLRKEMTWKTYMVSAPDVDASKLTYGSKMEFKTYQALEKVRPTLTDSDARFVTTLLLPGEAQQHPLTGSLEPRTLLLETYKSRFQSLGPNKDFRFCLVGNTWTIMREHPTPKGNNHAQTQKWFQLCHLGS